MCCDTRIDECHPREATLSRSGAPVRTLLFPRTARGAGNRISAIRLWYAAGPRPAADFGAAMRFPATVRVVPLAMFACTAAFCPMSEISVTKSHERNGGRDTL